MDGTGVRRMAATGAVTAAATAEAMVPETVSEVAATVAKTGQEVAAAFQEAQLSIGHNLRTPLNKSRIWVAPSKHW